MTIECEYDEVYSAPQVVSLAVAEANGVDGVFVNCFGDPGVRAVREKLKVPVFGGFEPAIYLGPWPGRYTGNRHRSQECGAYDLRCDCTGGFRAACGQRTDP